MASARKAALVWFKVGDLRLHDNPALSLAHANSSHVTHVFVFDPAWFGYTRVLGTPRVGYYRAKFLLESVVALRTALKAVSSTLVVRCGAAADVIQSVVLATGASTVYAQEEVADEELRVEASVRARLKSLPGSPTLTSVWGGSLYDVRDLPFRARPGGGKPSELPAVFSNYRRKVEEKCLVGKSLPAPTPFRPSHTPVAALTDVRAPDGPPFPLAPPGVVAVGANVGEGRLPSLWALGSADLLPFYTALGAPPPSGTTGVWAGAPPAPGTGGTIEDAEVNLLPARADARGVLPFRGGEAAALARVRHYIWDSDSLRMYKETRNGLMGADYSSKFSPWLAAGCLSPRLVAAEVAEYERVRVANDSTYWLLFELLWRDYMRLYALAHGTAIFKQQGVRGAAGGPARAWGSDRGVLSAWALGRTGWPFVDAGMRELLGSGFMSNRLRQNVASFLTRDAETDWRLGADWFEGLLIDSDVASNFGNWTYAAGVGADPREDRYFLIPKQSRDYDGSGEFMRHWLPQLSGVPVAALHDPRGMPRGSVRYPSPVCTLMAHRQGRGGGEARAPAQAGAPAAGGEGQAAGGDSRKARASKGNGVHPKHGRVQHL